MIRNPKRPAAADVLDHVQLLGAEPIEERLQADFESGALPHPTPISRRIVISQEDARTGGLVRLNVPVIVPCPACDGEGFRGPFACTHCVGTSRVDVDVPVTLVVPGGASNGYRILASLRHLGIHAHYLAVTVDVL